MTAEADEKLYALQQDLSAYKQELAKVIAGMQIGGERRVRRDLARRLGACKRRGRALSARIEDVLAGLDTDHEARPELETALVFLEKVQQLGEDAR